MVHRAKNLGLRSSKKGHVLEYTTQACEQKVLHAI